MAKIASKLLISPGLLSQILGGDRQFTPEAGLLLAEHIGLNERETDYLLLLIDFERAGSAKLKERILRQIKARQEDSRKLTNRIVRTGELDAETRATYYSSWTYTAIRNLTAVPGFQSIETIADRLALPRPIVSRVIEFLIEAGLCVRKESGEISYGPSWTHIGSDSRLVTKHHQNWRIRGLTRVEMGKEDDLFFTGPMSLSEAVAKEIRQKLPEFIEGIQKVVQPSPSETVRCLNIDWFEY